MKTKLQKLVTIYLFHRKKTNIISKQMIQINSIVEGSHLQQSQELLQYSNLAKKKRKKIKCIVKKQHLLYKNIV